MPISNLYTHVLLSHGKSNIFLCNTVILGGVQLAVVVSMLFLGIYYMVFAFVIVNIVWLFVWHYFVAKQIQIRLVDVFKDILPFLLLSIVSLSIACFIASFVSNTYMSFVLEVLVTGVLYALLLYMSGSVMFKETISFLLKRYDVQKEKREE